MNDGRPGIPVLISDQHSYATNGFAGDPYVSTPNLDALAADGCVSDTCSTACPLCLSARSAFLTTQMPRATPQ